MEPPSPAAPPVSAAAAVVVPPPPQPSTHLAYPDSVDSSPRSRNTDSWDEPLYPGGGGGGGMHGSASPRLRLMCSYGGHIVPRPHDKSLCYVGGDTRIVVADRRTSLSDLSNRLSKTLLNGRSFTLKYQLPNEDLDSLISVTTDEDLENMIDEYDRLNSSASATAAKSSRLRLFLFPSKPDSASSIGSLLENSAKSEDWFLNALNGATPGFSDSSSVNCLLGLEDDIFVPNNTNSTEKDVEGQIESFGNAKGVSGGSGSNKLSAQDVHSMPDSPMLETTSSFGSTSSSPSLASLPPIRVHVEDQKGGIEEQFSQMSVQQKQDEGGFVVLTSPQTVSTASVPAPTVVPGVPVSSGVMLGDYSNWVFSDDERSEQGIAVGYRRLTQTHAPPQQQPQSQFQPQQQQQSLPPQVQQKPTVGLDLPSPDSVSSDGSVSNPLSRKPMIYQDPNVQMPSGTSRVSANPVDPRLADPNSRVQVQQVPERSYVLQTQFDQQNPQLHQQQFVHPGTQYIHHHPAGAVPLASYYSLYPPQQHHPHHPALDQQYPVYYVAARQLGQAQTYNLPVQQPHYSEPANAVPSSRPQTPPAPAMVPSPTAYNPARNAPTSKPEPAGGAYRTAAAMAPSLVQVPSSQHQPQYVGFTQIHHPSQAVAPNSATANYGYEYADPMHAQIFYAQHMHPQLAAQFETMAPAPSVGFPESSGQMNSQNIMQQIKTSQP